MITKNIDDMVYVTSIEMAAPIVPYTGTIMTKHIKKVTI